jgi:hypothetical protein
VLPADIGDSAGSDPAVFDSTFGGDAKVLAARMAFVVRSRPPPGGGGLAPEAALAVGTCTAWSVGDVGWVHSLAVGCAHQGRGLARPLLWAVLGRLRALGHTSAMLAVRPRSHRALLLYLGCGFVPVLEDDADRAQWAAARWQAAAERCTPRGLGLTTVAAAAAATTTSPCCTARQRQQQRRQQLYCRRTQALVSVPWVLGSGGGGGPGLSEWALCGPSALLYSLLLCRPEALPRLLQLLFAPCHPSSAPTPAVASGGGGGGTLLSLAEGQLLPLMARKWAATLQPPPPPPPQRDGGSPTAAASAAAAFESLSPCGRADRPEATLECGGGVSQSCSSDGDDGGDGGDGDDDGDDGGCGAEAELDFIACRGLGAWVGGSRVLSFQLALMSGSACEPLWWSYPAHPLLVGCLLERYNPVLFKKQLASLEAFRTAVRTNACPACLRACLPACWFETSLTHRLGSP